MAGREDTAFHRQPPPGAVHRGREHRPSRRGLGGNRHRLARSVRRTASRCDRLVTTSKAACGRAAGRGIDQCDGDVGLAAGRYSSGLQHRYHPRICPPSRPQTPQSNTGRGLTNIIWSYFDSAYPWTRSDHTCDWSYNGIEYGLTEFLARPGAEVTV